MEGFIDKLTPLTPRVLEVVPAWGPYIPRPFVAGPNSRRTFSPSLTPSLQGLYAPHTVSVVSVKSIARRNPLIMCLLIVYSSYGFFQ